MKARNAKPSELAIHIRKTYSQLEQHTRSAVQKALRLGELLLAAKAAVAHGKFGKWVERKCPFSERQAERYMTLARERNTLDEANPTWKRDLTLNEALSLLSRLRNRDDQDEQGGEGHDEEGEEDNDNVGAQRNEAQEHHRRELLFRKLTSKLYKNSSDDDAVAGEIYDALDSEWHAFRAAASKSMRKAALQFANRVGKRADLPEFYDDQLGGMFLVLRFSEEVDPEEVFRP